MPKFATPFIPKGYEAIVFEFFRQRSSKSALDQNIAHAEFDNPDNSWHPLIMVNAELLAGKRSRIEFI